jgi:hypothetical protein
MARELGKMPTRFLFVYVYVDQVMNEMGRVEILGKAEVSEN